MEKNLDLIAGELFGKIRTRFPKITMKDEAGDPTDEENLARSFSFDFTLNSAVLGSVDIDLSEKEGLVVIFSNDIIDNQRSSVKNQWFDFLRELREFAKGKFMPYEVRDISKSNLDKRDYSYLSKKKQGDNTMSESKLWGGNKTSYQDLGETRLIIKHSQPVNLNIPAGRTMHIESIYIENAQGERFLYPHKHLNGARALAQHIAHGGTPYDDIGHHVIGLSEELGSLRKFKNYVGRTPMVAEAMNGISNKVIERIDQIKQEIHDLQKRSYYETFVESFTKSESQEIPEEIVNDWIERLTIKTFNEELKNVFPYIYKIVDESELPVVELDFNEIIDTTSTDESIYSKQSRVGSYMDQYENVLNQIIGESEDIFSKDENAQSAAIDKLNELISQELPVGTDGTNAIESLQGIISDNELEDIFKELADISPDSDARNILKDYISIKDQENGTDVLSKLNFGDEETQPEPPAEPAAEAPPAAPPAPAPAAEAPPAAPPAPAPAAPMAENLKKVIERAKRAGMQAEDKFTLFGKQITLADAIQRAGLDLTEFFDQSGYEDSGDEVVEFVRSMFDENGNTPKGPTGVLISVEKKFGEEALDKAKHVMNELMNQAEMRRIQELSGLAQPAPVQETGQTLDQAKKDPRYGKDPVYTKEVDKAEAFASSFDKPGAQSHKPQGNLRQDIKNIGKEIYKENPNESILNAMKKLAGIK